VITSRENDLYGTVESSAVVSRVSASFEDVPS